MLDQLSRSGSISGEHREVTEEGSRHNTKCHLSVLSRNAAWPTELLQHSVSIYSHNVEKSIKVPGRYWPNSEVPVKTSDWSGSLVEVRKAWYKFEYNTDVTWLEKCFGFQASQWIHCNLSKGQAVCTRVNIQLNTKHNAPWIMPCPAAMNGSPSNRNQKISLQPNAPWTTNVFPTSAFCRVNFLNVPMESRLLNRFKAAMHSEQFLVSFH